MSETRECKFCRRSDIGLMRYNGKLVLDMHKVAPGEFLACEGSFLPVREAVEGFQPPRRPEPAVAIGVQVTPGVPARAPSFNCALKLVKGNHAEPVVRDAVQERFEKFHAENPKVYEYLVRFAREAKDAGFKRFGMQAIVERTRWYVRIETKGDVFKINNDFSSRYARLIMASVPELEGFFETRVLKASKEVGALDDVDEEDSFWWQK